MLNTLGAFLVQNFLVLHSSSIFIFLSAFFTHTTDRVCSQEMMQMELVEIFKHNHGLTHGFEHLILCFHFDEMAIGSLSNHWDLMRS